ncbi:MAG: alpha/beta hydrolase [Candidatus Saccharimonadales bacterium]
MVIDKFLHKQLNIPYKLHIQYTRKSSKPRATIVFLHGIGSSGAEWQAVVDALPKDLSIITIDLLGFGTSPRPDWARYDAREQARSVIATLLRYGVRGKVMVVGHSLGALVAVEVAKRYPVLVSSLVLCSPPFYNPDRDGRLPNSDRILQTLFGQVERNQTYFLKLATLAIKYKLVNPAFSVTEETLPTYVQTLKASIISQSAYDDVMTLKCPITIIYGALDPLVIDKNVKAVAKANPHVTLARIIVGHEIIGRFVPTVVERIMYHIKQKETKHERKTNT